MAAESGRANAPLTQIFFSEAYRFDFFQAVRLAERIYPDRSPVGRQASDARSEVVRFRTRASLDFPPSQVHAVARNDDSASNAEGLPEMTVAFMGLTGPLGVLPNHYTELLIERRRYKDTTLWEFLDLFSHRFISLFYRAWEKYRFTVAYERGDQDRFTEYLFDFIGMGTRGLRHSRPGLPDEGLLLYGGLIAQQPHSAGAIEAVLGDYFSVPVCIEQFAGQWFDLDEESVSRLGTTNAHLGISTVVGTRVWDNQSKFRLKFGPLTLEGFKAFLPVNSAFKPATELVRFLAGMEFDFDIQLVLKADEVPGCVLSTRAGEAPRLGWTAWLKTREFAEDDSQVVLTVNQ